MEVYWSAAPVVLVPAENRSNQLTSLLMGPPRTEAAVGWAAPPPMELRGLTLTSSSSRLRRSLSIVRTIVDT